MAFSHRSYLSTEDRTSEFVVKILASVSSIEEEQAGTAESLEDEAKIRAICVKIY